MAFKAILQRVYEFSRSAFFLSALIFSPTEYRKLVEIPNVRMPLDACIGPRMARSELRTMSPYPKVVKLTSEK